MDIFPLFCYTFVRIPKGDTTTLKERPLQLKKALAHADVWVFFSCAVFLILFAISEIQVHLLPDRFPKSALFRLFLLCLICAVAYLGGMLYADRTKRKAVFPILLWIFFALYLYMILNLTLFDRGMGRANLLYNAPGDAREYYMSRFVNLTPFQSIYRVYIRGFLNGYVNAYYMLLNLLGNICAFMPFSFFLPIFFGLQRRWYVFLPTMLLTVGGVEALQFLFMVGSCDIDDLILNVGGAMILYFLLKIPSLHRATQKIAGK